MLWNSRAPQTVQQEPQQRGQWNLSWKIAISNTWRSKPSRWFSRLNNLQHRYIYSQYNHLFILLNIMFHAPMGSFQLELIYYFTYFSTVVPSNICVFLCCRPFVVNTKLSTGPVKHPQDLLKMLYKQRKAYRKETHKCWMGRQWKNR